MHHCSFCHGLISFFCERPPHRLVGDRRDGLQLDQLVGQQPHRPRLAAVRRRGAGHGDQPRLGPPVEGRLPAGAGLLLADQGGLQSLLDEPLPDPLDGGDADLGGLGDAGVRPGGAAG